MIVPALSIRAFATWHSPSGPVPNTTTVSSIWKPSAG